MIYRPVCVACQTPLGIITGIEDVAEQALDEHYAKHHPGLAPGEGGDPSYAPAPLLPVASSRATPASRRRPLLLIAAIVALAASTWLANYATTHLGAVPIGFGLAVTAGTFLAGAALLIRDQVHEYGRMPAVLVAIAAGGLVSWLTTPAFLAYASTVTFVVAELCDAGIYAKLRARSKPLGIAVSGLVGGIVDTALFLYLARNVTIPGTPIPLFEITAGLVVGQLIVKVGMSLVVAGTLEARDRRTAGVA